jgi:DNA-binding GntR family transcriptional regulator
MNRVSPVSLAATYGVSRQTIYEAIARYRAVRLVG